MSKEKDVSNHYLHGDLLKAIETALPKLGKTTDSITIEDLAPIDEFHIGGRQATENFLSQLNFSDKEHLLDIGCGLGGASRYISNKYNNRVTGIDLTDEYITTGNTLSTWLNLHNQVNLHQGSALSMPFQDESFDGAYMMHVGMNIENKTQLFKEIFRVLKPGTSLGVYDVMQNNDGDLIYPVPWASNKNTSYLAQPGQYKTALQEAGFVVTKDNNRRDFALDFFKALREKTEANGGPPPLGLHTLMQESTADKIKNMIHNITEGYIAPVEIISHKT
ncbi:MAG: SAM-dependent methyltransferase [endosymbiont of Galathealinum brachiosum]|uniref:SAM-dependent methyltransferase n=1 Tax=endosymbiont of Galathealinum brachiosum TaxID=2200906 RepID=A0A370D8J0_9GAMM|nr:MAG: SAM-dependent methyltransferase [endosymbiont of Galathealinum brachiosum]